MATPSVTHVFVNGTAADAVQVNTNFDDLVDFLNDEVIHADGSKAFTDNVSQPTTPTDANHLTRKGYVDDEAAKLIPKSIVDAAGDLIVGDAADSVVRLAKGTDGSVLRVIAGDVIWEASGNNPPGMMIAMDGSAMVVPSGTWFPVGGDHAEAPTAPNTAANTIEYIGPFFVSSSITVSQIGINFTSIGVGVNTRMALYSGTVPTTLIDETASTAATTGNNMLALGSNQTLTPGIAYWLAINYSATVGGVYHYSMNSLFKLGGAPMNSPGYQNTMKFNEAFTYGAFPATATPVAVIPSTAPAGLPNLFVKVV